MTSRTPYTPPGREQALGPPPRKVHPSALLGWLGPLGLLFVVAAFLMQGWAQRHGVHCPHCDRPPDFAWWVTYFSIRNTLFLAAFFGGLAALVAAPEVRWRLFGLGAMAVAFFGFGLMPM